MFENDEYLGFICCSRIIVCYGCNWMQLLWIF